LRILNDYDLLGSLEVQASQIMDIVYQVVEGLQFFIPIIAVVVVCGALFFLKNRGEDDEYLHSALLDRDENMATLEKCYDEMREIEKKES